MSFHLTLPGIANTTFSPGSEGGRLPCAAPDGQMTWTCGQAPALANLSPRQAKALGLLTSGTYGPIGTTSSARNALGYSLANKLRLISASLGSTLFRLTWRERTTPLGLPIPALRASVRRTSASGFTGWPTPRTPTGGPESAERKQELGRTESGGGDLQAVALLASWPTPNSRDEKTPPVETYAERGGGKKGESLGNLVALCLDSGKTPSGCRAVMGNPGRLNPALTRWLMGFPAEWCAYVVTAMRSLSSKRKRS